VPMALNTTSFQDSKVRWLAGARARPSANASACRHSISSAGKLVRATLTRGPRVVMDDTRSASGCRVATATITMAARLMFRSLGGQQCEGCGWVAVHVDEGGGGGGVERERRALVIRGS
jgi:hypothetical protein